MYVVTVGVPMPPCMTHPVRGDFTGKIKRPKFSRFLHLKETPAESNNPADLNKMTIISGSCGFLSHRNSFKCLKSLFMPQLSFNPMVLLQNFTIDTHGKNSHLSFFNHRSQQLNTDGVTDKL